MRARLCWQFKHNGTAGHGEYMPLALAWAWLKHSNDKEWGDKIDYWIETKAASPQGRATSATRREGCTI